MDFVFLIPSKLPDLMLSDLDEVTNRCFDLVNRLILEDFLECLLVDPEVEETRTVEVLLVLLTEEHTVIFELSAVLLAEVLEEGKHKQTCFSTQLRGHRCPTPVDLDTDCKILVISCCTESQIGLCLDIPFD